jgi:hypothetical protein
MSRPALACFPATALAAALALASGCAHQEPPSVDASPSAEATAALAPVTPFPPPVAHDPAPGAPALAATATEHAPLVAAVPVALAADASAESPEAQDPSDPTLPQTHDRPSAADPALVARIGALWAAVMADDPSLATSAFFPLAAYQQVKAINNPASDWNHRLMAAFAEDIHALHKRLGAQRASAKLTTYDLPDSRARWVEPNEEYNKIGYFRVFGTAVHYRFEGDDPPHEYSFNIASMISWRGQWYIVHLNGVR